VDPPGAFRIEGTATGGPSQPQGTPPSTIPFSGLANAIAQWKTTDSATIGRELEWQRGVGGDKTKIMQFQETAGGLQEFKTYLFVKPGSALCTIAHSPMKFLAILDATRHLQGHFIGFIGDRTSSREPTAVLFPTIKTWQWIKATVATDGPTLIDHYDEDSARRGTLWIPGADCETGEGQVPRLLHIPVMLFELIRNEGRPLMPHEILKLVIAHLESSQGPGTQQTGTTWDLIVKWWVVAAQHDSQGDSLVAFAVEAITEGDDAHFGQWVEQRLDGTLGKRPTMDGTHGTTTGAKHAGMVPQNFAAELGRGVALRLHALSPFKQQAGLGVGSGDADSKKGYGEEDIAALMGFSRVKRGDQLQDIWAYLQTAGTKNVDICRRQLMARMSSGSSHPD
jgi:hypothetical protein